MKGKVFHKVFKAVGNKWNNSLTTLWEPVSEVSHFIPEPGYFSEVTRLPEYVKNDWLKTTLKDIVKFYQQSDLYNGRPREGISRDNMHGCIQGKNPIWCKSWQVKVENCGKRRLLE